MSEKSGKPQGRASSPIRRKRLLRYVALLFVTITILVLAAINLFGFNTVRHGWNQVQPAVIAVKWGGMFVLIWRWRDVIHWATNRWSIDDAGRAWALGLRWRFAGTLVILEILFGQNLLAHIL